MLSGRFRTLLRFLNSALLALLDRGQDAANAANAAVAAIQATVAVRLERLTLLMDRFEAGTLRSRTVVVRAAGARRMGVRAAPLWPAHKAGWLDLVGCNHPSNVVRHRWTQFGSTLPAARNHMRDYAEAVRALVEQDAAMRGLLEASGEARRLVRWFLRATDHTRLPAILAEPPRPPRPPRPRKTRIARPWVRRVPAPFEAPPDNLMREERERRGMWVPPALRFYDLASVEFIPTADQLRPRWPPPDW